MGIIQCAENCKYQIEGYCNLDKCTTVNSLDNPCPYFISRSFNKGNGLREIGNADKLDC